MADGAAEACVCILFYGAEEKHFKLAQRVLNEPMRCLARRNIEFRFGCNAVGAETTVFLQRQIAEYFHKAVLFHSPDNIMKYPMMRRMLYAPAIKAPVTLWFDHDSYIEPDDTADKWFDRVLKNVAGCNLLGSVQKGFLPPEHLEQHATAAWFNPACENTYLSYVVGGWWAIKTDLLRRFDWPSSDLQQKNGEIVLSAMFKHQNLSLCHFREGVRVNVNDAGVEAAVPRTIDA